MGINSTDDAHFEADVLESTVPVLIDFWASWCQPCRALAPIVEAAAVEYAEKMKFFKIDVDQNQEISSQYGVRGIPTLLLIQNGQVVGTHVGLLSLEELKKFIEHHIH